MKLFKLNIPIDIEAFITYNDNVPDENIKNLIQIDTEIMHSICKSIDIYQIQLLNIPSTFCNGKFNISNPIKVVEIE